ncbi:MAG: hypothetical protein JKX69_06770 [Rhodobacteraceae bacterium]|nr:hypothetical protein [Paracoccaceae bacterium]
MSLSIGWIKLKRDFEAMGGRLALVVLAMVFGLVCTIAITSARAALTRDMATANTVTLPASGILDIGTVDAPLLARLRAMDGVASAEGLSIIRTRSRRADGSFGRALLFVSAEPLAQQIGQIRLEQTGDIAGPSVLLERRALGVAQVDIGGTVTLDIPGRGFTAFGVAGSVFDPALAPAEQEQALYAYMDLATWEALGGGLLELAEIRVTGDLADQEHVDAVLISVASALRAAGVNVHQLQISRAQPHPHQSQMSAVLVADLAQPLDFAYAQDVAPARANGLAITRSYPDGGHGSLALLTLEERSSLAHLTPLAGSLAQTDLNGGLVVNQAAHSLLGAPDIGDDVRLSLDGMLLTAPLRAVLR